MTTPTPEQLEAMIAVLDEAEAKTAESVIATAEQPLRHASSAWATEECGEECGDNHLKHKGAPLHADGWDDLASINLDGFYVKGDI